MSPRRENWQSLNSKRGYPLDDTASAVTDDGARLPQDLLVDLHLRFPSTLGRWAFLGGIQVSPRLVSVVILAAASPDAAGGFVPLASVTLPRPVREGQHYPLQALAEGVGGFLAFGDVSEHFTGRFSTPQQGLLAPRCARAYRPLPIPTLRKQSNAAGLSGLVRLAGGGGLAAAVESVTIEGHGVRSALVLRLEATPGENILAKFIGPCGQRPESRNCGKEGIETINGVAPDCGGNLNITFDGIVSAPYEGCGGEVLDLPVELEEVCRERDPERFIGRDQCAPSESSSSSDAEVGMFMLEAFEGGELLVDSLEPRGLPFRSQFNQLDAADFEPQSGLFAFESLEDPDAEAEGDEAAEAEPFVEESWSLAAIDTSRRNVILWQGQACGDVRLTADALVVAGAGQRRNAALILGHRPPQPYGPWHEEHLIGLLDLDASCLRLLRFAGLGPPVELARASLPRPLATDRWVRLQADVLRQGAHGSLRLEARGVSDPEWPGASLAASVRWPESGCLYGLGSLHSHARFAFFHLEELA